MIEGNNVAHAKSTSKYIEMRGTYRPDISKTEEHGQFLMHYAFDEIHVTDKVALFIEHKNVTDPSTVETWYLQSSLLQTAVYQALVNENQDRNLFTATFHVNEGNDKLHLELGNRYNRSELHIGTDKYTVIVNEKGSKCLIEFYIHKAIASMDYRTAEQFDSEFKHREYEALKKYFTFRPIQEA